MNRLQLIETDELKPQARSSLRRIIEFRRWRFQAQAVDHIELAETVLDDPATPECG